MNKLSRNLYSILIVLIGTFNVNSSIARPWTARDSVELCRISGSVKFSPDGSRFLVVTSRGVLSSNEIESTILMFDTASVKSFCVSRESSSDSLHAGGVAIVKMAADTYDDTGYPVTISNLTWDKDGKKFYFLARGKKWENRLFKFDLQSKQIKQLSADGDNIATYVVQDGQFIYLKSKSPDPVELFNAGAGPDAPDMVLGAGRSSTELLFPTLAKFNYQLFPLSIHKLNADGRELAIGRPFLSYSPQIYPSPDSKHFVVKAHVQSIPSEWSRYEPRRKDYRQLSPELIDDEKTNMHRPEQWLLVDASSGQMKPLTNTPDGELLGYYDDAGIAWSPDGKRVAVANSFFPIRKDVSAKEILRPCVSVVDLENGSVELLRQFDSAIKQLPVWNLAWDASSKTVHIEGDGLRQAFEKNGAHWSELGAASKIAAVKLNGIQVEAIESPNSPQVLLATTSEETDFRELYKANKAKVILNPNPQLSDVDLGDFSIYKWKDKEDRECVGGLLKPSKPEPGKHYPLLVQTHSFFQYQFFNLGSSTTGNTGRVLAAKGVVILQAGEPRRGSKFAGTEQEAEKDGRDCYIAAIEQLAKEGLIDPSNVGLLGFSRTGWYVLDTLINSPKYFKAATLADSNSSSYGEYLRNLDMSADGSNYLDADYGCKPYGEGLKTWISRASGFNLDKIKAPILVQYNSPYGMLDWSTYPVLRMMNKPVELLYFRNGSHTLSKPKLVFKSVETNTDWFDFWLNNHEDPDPSKAIQYKRWRALRKLKFE